jgi:hypothetical protein
VVDELLKLVKENGQELVFNQSPKEYARLFEAVGMKVSHQESRSF